MEKGFTLLEVIVSIAIFSLMSIVAYSGLRNFTIAQQALETHEQEFAKIQHGVNLIEQDMANLVARPIRDEFGDAVAALIFTENDALQLTRRRVGLPLEFALLDLKRIDYFVEDEKLMRRSWEALDRTQETRFQSRLVLSGVRNLSWRFYSDRWVSFWPLASDLISQKQLPIAVEFQLTLADGRRIERLMLVTNRG